MGNFRKKAKAYVKKQARRAGQWAKKRYLGPGGMANVLKDVNMLKTAINVEKKYHDVENAGYTAGGLVASNPYVFTPFEGLEVGTAENQRNGDQIKALWTTMKIHVELQSDLNTPASTMYRVIAFYDKECRGDAALNASTYRSQLLAYTASGKEAILSPYKLDGLVGDRFKIVRDFRFTLDNVSRRQKLVSLNFNHTKNRTKGLRLKYFPVAGADNDIPSDDRLVILIMNDDGSAFGSGYTAGLTTVSRMCFVDN